MWPMTTGLLNFDGLPTSRQLRCFETGPALTAQMHQLDHRCGRSARQTSAVLIEDLTQIHF